MQETVIKEATASPSERHTYDSILAAQYLRALGHKEGIILNVTKVQKLLFIAYGVYLAATGHILLDESPKAWPFGPVFPKTRTKVDYGQIIAIDHSCFEKIAQDDFVTKLFEDLINTYSPTSASALSEWSHMEGSPWYLTTKLPGFKWNDPIKNEFILDFFKRKND
jgi:uncharacterized phage-associated protein